MRDAIDKVKADPRYQRNIEYGEPRSGHPEGKVKFHIADLEANLEKIRERGITSDDYWKLKFMIHIHDSFKAEAEKDSSAPHSRNHATLAREYASQYTSDADLLNMIQYHDENYKLWKDFSQTGKYDAERFQNLLAVIQNWDLFLLFIIIDGCVNGKVYEKLAWFIDEVKKHRETVVDASWILPP
ncbi:MAG: hypothetical protein PHQ36_13720 [Anaerolineales bacterium]|nr:hypothetical protein [Anaerolineales bacterium]